VIDGVLAVVVASVAYVVVRHHLTPYYHMAPWIEDLLVPCTGRPGWVPDPAALKALPQWQAFVGQQTAYFPCDAIAGMPLSEVGIAWQREEYFHLALATWFRIVGPKIDGFITFQSLLFALTSGIAYLVFRLGMWRIVALACTAALVWSPTHLWAAGLPIEYAKAPWMLATVALCGLVLSRDARRASLWAPALAAGLAAGIGIGFKTDVLVAVPLAIATMLLFVRTNHGGASRKAIAALCVITGVVLGGGLVIYRDFFGAAGSLLPVQILGGQDWITEATYAANPLYDYGLIFDDSHITALINAYGQRVLGSTSMVFFFSREMQEMSTRLLADYWTTFPGDFVLRVIAATIRVLQLNGLGLLVAVTGLLIAFAKDLRAGWFIAFVTLYLSACASLVFQRRHAFHLEFISWGLAGFIAQAIVVIASQAIRNAQEFVDGWRGSIRPAARALLCVSLIAVCGMSMLAAARRYQQQKMLGLVARYLQVPGDERLVVRAASDANAVTLRIDGLSLRDRQPIAGPHPTPSDYVVARFTCRDDRPIDLTAAYVSPPAGWDRHFRLLCAGTGSTSTLMVPVYQYGPAHVFDGLTMSAEDADLVQSVSTMRHDPGVRLWLNLLVPADWRGRDWVERLKFPPAMPL
jgi:hypothetical protein